MHRIEPARAQPVDRDLHDGRDDDHERRHVDVGQLVGDEERDDRQEIEQQLHARDRRKRAAIIAERALFRPRAIMDHGRASGTASDHAPGAACAPGGGLPARRRRDRLSDRLVLRARLRDRRQGGDGAHPAHPADGQTALLHRHLPRPLGDRPVRARGELAVPAAEGVYPRTVHVRAARDTRGAPPAARAAPQDGRHPGTRPSGGACAPGGAGRAAHEHHPVAAGR